MDTLQRGLRMIFVTAFTTRIDESRHSPRARRSSLVPLKCIFFLTFERTDSIYESRCDFFLNRKFEMENQSMKNATKKAAAKKKAPAKKKK
jgi:hypothetical protein